MLGLVMTDGYPLMTIKVIVVYCFAEAERAAYFLLCAPDPAGAARRVVGSGGQFHQTAPSLDAWARIQTRCTTSRGMCICTMLWI